MGRREREKGEINLEGGRWKGKGGREHERERQAKKRSERERERERERYMRLQERERKTLVRSSSYYNTSCIAAAISS